MFLKLEALPLLYRLYIGNGGDQETEIKVWLHELSG